MLIIFKQLTLASMESRVISDFASNTCNAVIVGSVVFVSTAVNKISPMHIAIYPNYLLIYFYQFIIPFIVIGSTTLVYFLRHPPLRKSLAREVKYFKDKLSFLNGIWCPEDQCSNLHLTKVCNVAIFF